MIFKAPRIDGGEIEVIAKIDEFRKNLQPAVRTPSKWTGTLRKNMIARAIRGSNTVEGYNVTLEEAVAVVEHEEIDVDSDTRLAIEGYRNALTYILHLAEDKQHYVVNEELLRSLHYIMLSHDWKKHPGHWRPGPIYVRREPSGERVYEGPDSGLVPELMKEFVETVQNCDDSIPVLIRAAMAHLNLVLIHPFSDGNGRMGRAVQTLVLARDGILPPEFSSIEEYLGSRNNTESYYSVLAEVGAGSWHPERDARPFVRFCLRAHLQQLITIDRRIREISRLFGDLETEISNRGLNPRMISALYDAAVGFRVRSMRYQSGADVSPQVAARDLGLLVEQGLLEPHGEKRGRVYVGSQRLFDIREKCREARKILPADIFSGQLKLL